MDVGEVRGQVDFGIITIREDELEAVLERFPEDVGTLSGRRQYNLRRIAPGDPYLCAIVRCAVQANSEAQQVANALLDELAPRWLLIAGIAGGAPAPEFTLGDVVVGTEVCDFNVGAVLKDGSREYTLHGWMSHPDVAKLAANLPAMRKQLGDWSGAESVRCPRPGVVVLPKAVYGSAKWKKRVTEVKEQHVSAGRQEPKVTAGAIACSDLVMKDAELFQVWLKLTRQVIAVEMESAGAAKAAQERQVPFMSIRGLSDIVGFSRDPKWIAYACHTAAAFTRAFLLTRPIPPGAPSRTTSVGPELVKPPALLWARRARPRARRDGPPHPCAFDRPPRHWRHWQEHAHPPRLVRSRGRDPLRRPPLVHPTRHRPDRRGRRGPRRGGAGITPRGRPLPEACAFLAGAPGVLALDNLETPWEGDREGTDALLAELAGIPGLVLVASVPLAITLLAHAAEGASLAGLTAEWERKRTALLAKEGAKPGRETSWAASMALSVGSPRMTEEARRLLGLLGRLPDGVAFADLDALIPGEGSEAERKLVQVGLAYEEGSGSGCWRPSGIARGRQCRQSRRTWRGRSSTTGNWRGRWGRRRAGKAGPRPLHGSGWRRRTWMRCSARG
jgi:nucleoside phosphorylase